MAIRNSVARAAFSAFMAASKSSDPFGGNAQGFAEKAWPQDPAAHAIVGRAAVAPASAANTPALISTAVADFIGSLAPASAAARLMKGGLQISLGSNASIAIPTRTSRGNLSFVAEGSAIPVVGRTFGTSRVGPLKKLSGITIHSRELAKAASVEAIFEALLREDVADSLDAAMFGTSAATDAAPAGLLAGIAPLPAIAGGDRAAMEADLVALSAAITAAGASDVKFVTTPRLAMMARLRMPELSDMIWAAHGLPAGRVIAVDPSALVFATGGIEIEASSSAILHTEDAAPLQISAAGGPVAAPTRSTFQTATVATRLIFDVGYALRAGGLVAYLEGATW